MCTSNPDLEPTGSPDYRPDIAADQVALLRESLSLLSAYACLERSVPAAEQRLSVIARVADAVSDLAYAWDWGGYSDCSPAKMCAASLRELLPVAPDVVGPIAGQLDEVIHRLSAHPSAIAEAADTTGARS